MNTLPTHKDFDPWGDLDAQSAWGNFGGLTLEEAHEKFCNVPESYYEDFTHMGANAFSYYFPVIDKYLRNIKYVDEWDNCEASIIGSGIVAQLEWENNNKIKREVINKIEDLYDFVINNLSNYSSSQREQKSIFKSWQKVKSTIEKYDNS